MNEKKILWKQEFLGKEIPIMEDKFGKNKEYLTDEQIAEIHDMKVFHVRELIKNNINRFKENIDYVDLLSNEKFYIVVNDLEFKCSNRIKNIFMLSERGYAKLIKIMNSDKAWEIYDELINEYFTMKEVINSDEK